MSQVDVHVVQPDNDQTDYLSRILSSMNAEYRRRGDLGDLDAMEASFGTVAASVVKEVGATGIAFPNMSTVVFYFGHAPLVDTVVSTVERVVK